MPGRFFLDSNIILYSFDTDAPEKRAKARQLIAEASTDDAGCISTQVVQECLSFMTSRLKLSLTSADALNYLKNILEPLTDPLPPLPLYRDALSIHNRWKFSFYDALIVAAALALDCDRLYSEDFQHGQRIENLTVVNPFMG